VNAAKLSRKAAIVAIVAGDVLLLATGWFLLISPQRSTAASIVRATQATAAQLIEAKRPIRQVQPAAVQQPEIRTADVYSLAKAMPSTLDMPTLLLELDQIARSAGVTLSTIAPGQPALATTFSTVPISLTVSGNFYSLTDLLYRLRTLVSVHNGQLQTSGRLLSIDSVTLAPTAVGSGLTSTVTLTAYIYGTSLPGAVAAPVAAALPATTGTDTTSTTTTSPPPADIAPGP
jgi:Tfp pilus assembly protein PilO